MAAIGKAERVVYTPSPALDPPTEAEETYVGPLRENRPVTAASRPGPVLVP